MTDSFAAENRQLDNELTEIRNNQQSLEDKLAEQRRSLKDKESEIQTLKAELVGLRTKVTEDTEQVEKARKNCEKRWTNVEFRRTATTALTVRFPMTNF